MLSLVYPFRNTLVSLALAALVVSAEPGAHVRPRTPLNIARRHHNVTLSESETRLGKRFENTRFTFFGVGQNACGSFDHDGDFIVALNTHQWDDGSHCYAPITVSYQGKSANAKITDECEECPYGAIDLSPGLFKYLVPGGLDQGEAYGSWNYAGAEEPKPSPSPMPEPPPPEPKTTSTTHERPTSAHTTTPPATTSSSSTQQRPTSSSSPSSSAHSTSSKAASSTSAPTATVTSFDGGNLNQFNMAVLALVDLILAGPGVTA